jgi:hypothetical protein
MILGILNEEMQGNVYVINFTKACLPAVAYKADTRTQTGKGTLWKSLRGRHDINKQVCTANGSLYELQNKLSFLYYRLCECTYSGH